MQLKIMTLDHNRSVGRSSRRSGGGGRRVVRGLGVDRRFQAGSADYFCCVIAIDVELRVMFDDSTAVAPLVGILYWPQPSSTGSFANQPVLGGGFFKVNEDSWLYISISIFILYERDITDFYLFLANSVFSFNVVTGFFVHSPFEGLVFVFKILPKTSNTFYSCTAYQKLSLYKGNKMMKSVHTIRTRNKSECKCTRRWATVEKAMSPQVWCLVLSGGNGSLASVKQSGGGSRYLFLQALFHVERR